MCGLMFIVKLLSLFVALRRIVDVLRKVLKSNWDDILFGVYVFVVDILVLLVKFFGL